ncbi:MAG: glycosyltransferase family 1 protein, partial [Nitrospirota bacterium]
MGYNGANESLRPLTSSEKTEYRNKISKGLPYFIFIGALTPRKNLARLFTAFDLYFEKSVVK